MADETGGFAGEEMAVRRFSVATLLVGMLFNGCAAVVDSGSAEPAPISPTQFLRPIRDGATDTWVAAWVDPTNHQFVSATSCGEGDSE